jgi:hypothetical protein
MVFAMTASFTWFSDPGHSWLRVSAADLRALGLTPRDFTSRSRRENGVFYLDGVKDAPLFITRWKAKHGNEPKVHISHGTDASFVQRLPHNTLEQ